jgi:DNA-binding transcriptional LysR family regulator
MLSLLARDGAAFTIQPWVGLVPAIVDGVAVLPVIEPTMLRTLAVVWSTARPLSLAAEEVKRVLERIVRELPATELTVTAATSAGGLFTKNVE